MSFFNIVLNNIKKKFGSYLIYFISTIFSVTIFSIFCSIYYNPQFSGYRLGSGKMAVIFKVSAIAIILFSSIFVLYSNSFFVKTLKKEIAIYSLLGMKKSQIARMLFYENIFMGILATACGVVLGVVFSRFFTMILFNLMAAGTKVSFSIQWEAIVTTLAAFLILFVISSLNAYGIIYRYKLIELLSANKEGEKIPEYSVFGTLVSVVIIIIGYIIAMTMNVNEGGFKLLIPSLFVLFFVVSGTLLLFNNFIPMAMVTLKKYKSFYYLPENFISISQIVYRIKANSKMLSVIAILCAATITLMSATYSMYKGLETVVEYYSPFSYLCKNADDAQYNEMLEAVKKIGKDNVTSANRFKLVKVQGQNTDYSTEVENRPGMTFDAFIISQSDYKSIISNTKVKTGSFSNIKTNFNLDLKDNECYFIDGNTTKEYCENLTGSTMNVLFSNNSSSYDIVGVSLHKYIGFFDLYKKPTVVLRDETYNEYLKAANADNVVSFTGLMFDKPMNSESTVEALNKIAPENKQVSSSVGIKNISYIGFYKSVFSLFGVYVFIGMFIGILFLLASGSIMYYKQIIEAQEEVNRYDILKKIGMSRKEVKQSISKQLAISFGMPLLIGLIHSVFALLTYNRMMDLVGKETPTMLNAFIIVVFYVIFYCFFYALSVKSYMRIVWGKEK